MTDEAEVLTETVTDVADEVWPENRGERGGPPRLAHDIPMSAELRAAMAQDWDPAPPMPHPARPDGAPYAARRRAALSAAYPGQLVVVPACPLKTRANDTE